MTISVLGAIVYDEITTYQGERRESFGGILYNIAALCSIVPPGTRIRPVCNVGEDKYEQVIEILSGYPGVELAAVQRAPGHITHAKLHYRSMTYRDEVVLYMMRPLALERIGAVAGSDVVLVNFVNGTEMDLDTFAALREVTDAPIHVDIHNRVARFDEQGKKSIVGLPEWRDWVKHAHSVQMNEFECENVVGRKLSSEADYVQAGHEILQGGAPIVLITLGPLGSIVVYRREGKAYYDACPAAPIEKVVDTTGCGDSFSAGFVVNYMECRDPLRANAAANIVAGTNCEYAGIGRLEKARNALAQIPKAFPHLAAKISSAWPGSPL